MITVANILVKLCEKIAAKRVTAQPQKEGRLRKEVVGARPKRSTTSNIDALIYTIYTERPPGRRTFSMGLYDLVDAYNRVHIADKMIKYGISWSGESYQCWTLGDLKCDFAVGSLSSFKLALACHKVPL